VPACRETTEKDTRQSLIAVTVAVIQKGAHQQRGSIREEEEEEEGSRGAKEAEVEWRRETRGSRQS